VGKKKKMFPRAFLLSLMAIAANAFVVVPNSSARTNTALQVAIDTSDIKNGLTIELDGEPYKVLSFSIMKQARGAAKTTIKFKNLMRGTTIENTYRSGERFETALIEKKSAQYTYGDEVRVGWILIIATFAVS
jgi:elongation factor P